MKPSLCISFRFIQPHALFHGRGEGDEPEWPPSPLRAFQALVNAAGLRTRGKPLAPELQSTLRVIEQLRPIIIAPRTRLSVIGYRAYVPHNQYDLVFAGLQRGMEESTEVFRKLNGSVRVEKDFRPHRIEAVGEDVPAIHYIYPLDATGAEPAQLLQAIRPAVRSIHCLGWGIDQVIADAMLVEPASHPLVGERWAPAPRGGKRLRAPRNGSLDALIARHAEFLARLASGSWTPVPPLTTMDYLRYRRDCDPVPRPHAIFKLLDENDDTVTYPQSKFVHVAGMVRHLAIEMMKKNPPRDLRGRTASEWVESYVAGHQSNGDKNAGAPHTQLSYIPLQSIGNPNTDPGVRRVMIVAPIGDNDWLDHLARHLDGVPLQPRLGTLLPPGTHLERIDDDRKDGVRDAYLRASASWASVTPVILPGHDDRKPQKTRSLILKALQQSGVEQPCRFEWSAFSRFRKMLPAHKYRTDPNDPSRKIPINYIRPDHLLAQTAVHLTVTFANGTAVPGPLALGPGRHCGFGMMAALDEPEGRFGV
jgi:CRISPR-associated protein Csb2